MMFESHRRLFSFLVAVQVLSEQETARKQQQVNNNNDNDDGRRIIRGSSASNSELKMLQGKSTNDSQDGGEKDFETNSQVSKENSINTADHVTTGEGNNQYQDNKEEEEEEEDEEEEEEFLDEDDYQKLSDWQEFTTFVDGPRCVDRGEEDPTQTCRPDYITEKVGYRKHKIYIAHLIIPV